MILTNMPIYVLEVRVADRVICNHVDSLLLNYFVLLHLAGCFFIFYYIYIARSSRHKCATAAKYKAF